MNADNTADTPLMSVESEIQIEFDTPAQAELIFNSVKPEISSSPSQRSSMKMRVEENLLYLKINAIDATSFRASLNSSIRWIILSLEVLDIKK